MMSNHIEILNVTNNQIYEKSDETLTHHEKNACFHYKINFFLFISFPLSKTFLLIYFNFDFLDSN